MSRLQDLFDSMERKEEAQYESSSIKIIAENNED